LIHFYKRIVFKKDSSWISAPSSFGNR